MSASPQNLGVAAPSGTPPQWPDAAQLSPLPTSRPITSANTWPRPALWATVILLCVALSLIGWNVYAAGRWGARPATLDREAVRASRLDLNRADRAQLLQLNGLGEVRVASIIEYRDAHHGFRSVDELLNIKGIGPLTLEKLRPFVYVEPPDADEENEQPNDLPLPPAKAVTKPAAKPAMGNPAAAGGKKADDLKGLIDVNRASAEELQRLPRVGAKTAEKIIAARNVKPFEKVDDLRRVSGIGVKTLDGLRPFVTVGKAEPEKKD
jgi:competence ComEA-like helix-hairpin-helix protein